MSRSGYSDDYDQWSLIRWRGAVASAIRGKRGQALLREMLAALDAMPEKALIARDFLDAERDVCALGAVAVKRGMELSQLDPDDREGTAEAFGVADALTAEIVYENDEGGRYGETPQDRWKRVRAWVASNIRDPR